MVGQRNRVHSAALHALGWDHPETLGVHLAPGHAEHLARACRGEHAELGRPRRRAGERAKPGHERRHVLPRDRRVVPDASATDLREQLPDPTRVRWIVGAQAEGTGGPEYTTEPVEGSLGRLRLRRPDRLQGAHHVGGGHLIDGQVAHRRPRVHCQRAPPLRDVLAISPAGLPPAYLLLGERAHRRRARRRSCPSLLPADPARVATGTYD